MTIWSGQNFTGDVLLKKKGPAVIYNVHWKGRNHQGLTEKTPAEWQEPLQTEFPQWTRVWSKTDMYDSDGDGEWPFDYWWEKGSFKVE